MSKEYVKSVSIGQDKADKETERQEVREYETDAEDTKALIRANEEDFIQGLIDAAEFASEETQRIEIIRVGRWSYAFNIRPLSTQEKEEC